MSGPVFVSNSATPTSPSTVAEFAVGARGNVAPSNIVGGPDKSNLKTASGIIQDADGSLYVVAPIIDSINVYPPGASGDVAPFAVLAGKNAGLANPQGIAIRDGKLYVANGPFGPGPQGTPSVAVFTLPLAPGRNNVAPVAVIAGPDSGLDSPFGLALDSMATVYVANLNNTVTAHATPATSSYKSPDNAPPILTISTGLAGPEGLAIRDDTLYVSNDNDTIAIFALAGGAPEAVIAGPSTMLAAPLGICVDSSGHLFVVNTANQVLEFAAGAAGNVAPIAIISGPATTLDSPQFVFAGT